MRILICLLLAAVTGWCADVNITNVTTATGTVPNDYVLGLTNTATSIANGRTRLIRLSSVLGISSNYSSIVSQNASNAANARAQAGVALATNLATVNANNILTNNNAGAVSLPNSVSIGGAVLVTNTIRGTTITATTGFVGDGSGLTNISGVGSFTNVTLYGTTVVPSTLQASNLIVTNMSVDTMNVSILTVTNGITASTITATTGFTGNGASVTNVPWSNLTFTVSTTAFTNYVAGTLSFVVGGVTYYIPCCTNAP